MVVRVTVIELNCVSNLQLWLKLTVGVTVGVLVWSVWPSFLGALVLRPPDWQDPWLDPALDPWLWLLPILWAKKDYSADTEATLKRQYVSNWINVADDIENAKCIDVEHHILPPTLENIKKLVLFQILENVKNGIFFSPNFGKYETYPDFQNVRYIFQNNPKVVVYNIKHDLVKS